MHEPPLFAKIMLSAAGCWFLYTGYNVGGFIRPWVTRRVRTVRAGGPVRNHEHVALMLAIILLIALFGFGILLIKTAWF